MDKNTLIESGIDYDAGVNRFVGNAAMFEAFLGKFVDDETFSQLKAAMEKQDYLAAFNAANTLKGVAGNLSMVRLYDQIVPFVDMLRNESDIPSAVADFPALETGYREMIDLINSQR